MTADLSVANLARMLAAVKATLSVELTACPTADCSDCSTAGNWVGMWATWTVVRKDAKWAEDWVHHWADWMAGKLVDKTDILRVVSRGGMTVVHWVQQSAEDSVVETAAHLVALMAGLQAVRLVGVTELRWVDSKEREMVVQKEFQWAGWREFRWVGLTVCWRVVLKVPQWAAKKELCWAGLLECGLVAQMERWWVGWKAL